MKHIALALAVIFAFAVPAEENLPAFTETTLRRSLDAMATLQSNGGWGMAWTDDGKLMWGEYKPIPKRCITVQPPATPSIADVYLRATQVLKDTTYAQRAYEARDALLKLQSPQGGFPHEGNPQRGPGHYGSYDDNVTTGALDFLLALWAYTGTDEDRLTVESVGDFLLVSQYPDSGGWPQALGANGKPRKGYGKHITFNDGAMVSAIRALLKLHKRTGNDQYLQAAITGGDAIIRLQGGPGEAVWAQQYDAKTLKPAWARKFESPGYTPAESVGVCDVLIELYLYTGMKRFLEPLPKAFAWYESSRLPNGKWARLYEPSTHRPVYGRRDKAIPVYSLEEACSGYSWQSSWYPHAAKKAYERIQAMGRDAYLKERDAPQPPPKAAQCESRVRDICDSISPEGWWLREPNTSELKDLAKAKHSPDCQIIHAGTFCRNAAVLLDYLECVHREPRE